MEPFNTISRLAINFLIAIGAVGTLIGILTLIYWFKQEVMEWMKSRRGRK